MAAIKLGLSVLLKSQETSAFYEFAFCNGCNLFAKVLNRESAASVDILTAVSKASKYFWMHNVSQSEVDREIMFFNASKESLIFAFKDYHRAQARKIEMLIFTTST